MIVANHLLDGATVKRTPNVGGMMTPTGVIMHYTAGYTAAGAVATLSDPASKASAHLVIDRDGTITQLVPFNRVAWHAGPSALDDINGCNSFCIGFEFVNPGWFKHGPGTAIVDAYGHTLTPTEMKTWDVDHAILATNSRIGGGTFLWPAYSDAQINAGLTAFGAICDAYKIRHIAGHEEVDLRKWKTDPGPSFPMSQFKAKLHGKLDRSNGDTAHGTAITTAKVNVRQGPASTAPVICAIEAGAEVAVKSSGATWNYVEYAPGRAGYIAATYLKAV